MLEKVGIKISSNYCAAWCDDMPERYRLPATLNDIFQVTEDVWELPITSFRDFPLLRPMHLRPLQIAAASSSELTEVLARAVDMEIRVIVVLLHSFEWIESNSSSRLLNRKFLTRFLDLCKWLESHKDKVITCRYSDLVAEDKLKALAVDAATAGRVPKSKDLNGSRRLAWHSARRLNRYRRNSTGWTL